jgi:signal transduction histidine kinase
MDKLFRSFSQIDESITRSFGGSGLGLIISKDLAKLLGGDCTAVSEYGKGSKFTFSFVAESTSDAPFKYNAFPSPKCVMGPYSLSWMLISAGACS